MKKTFKLVDIDTDDVRIIIKVSANDDGSLRIDDWSMGAMADLMYGDGADVESWITVSTEATRKLSVKLFRGWVVEPAVEVGQYLATHYSGDTAAVRKIEELLKSLDVEYERMMWP